MQYGTATIQHFLSTKFGNEQLTSICYDYFPEVYLTFDAGITRDEKVQRLLTYCQRRDRISSLLAMMERERPVAYKSQYSSVLGVTATKSKLGARRNPRQLYISHSYEDSKLAGYLADDLRRRGWPIWIARDSVRPGEKWLEAVNRGLDESSILLLVLTPDAVGSDWVHSETSLAMDQNIVGQLELILVEMKPTAEVPTEWNDHQRLPFNRGYKQGIQTLHGVLESLVGPPPRPVVPPAAEAGVAAAASPAAKSAESQATEQAEVEPPAAPIVTGEATGAPATPPVEPPAIEPATPVSKTPEPASKESTSKELAAIEPVALVKRQPAEPAVDMGGNILWEKDGKEMVRIPGGAFLYGEAKEEASLPDYWIDKTPVTNSEYARFIAASGRKPPGHWGGDVPPAGIAQHPVVFVSWGDAAAYAAWFGKRLPKEEEWEKAARGRDGRVFPWGDEEPTAEHCNFDNNVGSTTPVKRYSPQGDSCYGCTDMAGNVWEWTDSTMVEVMQVFRGGAFNRGMEEIRAANRDGFLPDERKSDLGFRTVVRLSEAS
jgi:formylglycine-generating enzyme required for sulfatase activity